MDDASSKRAFAAGTVLQTSSHIPTNCAPCPGNMKATFEEKLSKSLSLVADDVAASVDIRSRPRRAAYDGGDAACWNAAACLSADSATVAIMAEAKGVIV